MSEMSSEETPSTGADLINTALVGFVGCIGEALEDICSYGLTIGETYVPFDPDEDEDCDADEAICSQMWVRVMSVDPVDTDSWDNGCGLVMRLQLEVGVIRCLEIPEGGEAPAASDVLVAAMQAMDDMNTILCAALGCEVWNSIDVGQWQPSGPLGGQYGGTWDFTVEI